MNRIRKQIDNSTPVVIGLYISDTFNTPHAWDKIGSEFALGMDNGQGIDPDSRHAAVVVGRGTYSGVPVYLLRNSWGRDWGNDGHAWVREENLKLRIYDGRVGKLDCAGLGRPISCRIRLYRAYLRHKLT